MAYRAGVDVLPVEWSADLAAGVDHHLGALRWPIDRRKHDMERFYFAYGYGWIRWEAWTTNTATLQDTDLLGRCPGVYIDGGPWRLPSQPRTGARLRAGRTNIIYDLASGRRRCGISWSP
jgi:hypothetical protein